MSQWFNDPRIQFYLTGEQHIGRMDKPVKVTVILNPMAKHGKARKLFEKNVAPLLYLAGFEVIVIKTEHEGQAKQYMDVLDETDYIVVAGGDGTLQEVVTGILRRKDQHLTNVPIGVIPLGVVNSFASCIHGDRESELVRWLLDCGMSIVNGILKPVDVLSITSDEDKTVYSMSGVDFGLYRTAIDRVNKHQKYWWLGALKHRMTALRSVLKSDWPPVTEAEVTYSNSCDGCNKCRPAPQWRWWHILFKPQVEDFSKIVNETCGTEYSESLNGLHMVINSPNVRDSEQDGVGVSVIPDMDRTSFLKHAMSLIGAQPYSEKIGENQITDIGTLTLKPNVEKGTAPFYNIDNEDFEASPITVALLRDRIRVFAPPAALT